MALTPSSEEAFVREVDEELRRDEAMQIWQRWGRWMIGAVVAGLLIFGGVLWWRQHQQDVAAEQGEKMHGAFQDFGGGKISSATAAIDALAASKSAGYRETAKLVQANLALNNKDLKTAAARFGEVANDEKTPQPLRELALIRQTSIEFDTLKPQTVVQRLAPLAVKGSPWFGSAGEMVAIANLRLGKRDLAVRMLRAMASDIVSARAKAVGALIASRAKEAGVQAAVFDRGGRLYHGRVAALAEGAREGGLKI